MKNRKRLLSVAMLLVFGLALLAGATHASAAADEQKTNVKIDNFTFSPATVTIKAGSTVHWTNGDDIPHNVVSTDKLFKSKVMDTNEEFDYTFEKPGTYEYFCGLHPKMTAKVIVQ